MNKKYFHFTLGPVQSFVGQARRTRDFWAGSFLLSWLSGVAMQAVIAQGGKILFPVADQDFLDAINGKGSNKPTQGSVPNRFKAEVDANFDANQVITNLQAAWQQLAGKIYDAEIKNHANEKTQAIWDRQVNHFWDMTWVLIDDQKDSTGLDKRKNWRSHYLPAETGTKCTLMGDWQELSGIEGVGGKHRIEREQFWNNIANHNSSGKHDFAEKEHLCAMAYIKRRFIKYFADLKIDLDGFVVHGWQLPQAVPSVAYIAAALWYAKVLQEVEEMPEFTDFFDAAKESNGLSEYETKINCIENASKNNKHKGIDGGAFHISDLENINKTGNQIAAQKTKRALQKLIKNHGAISPFYAVLMMDGDSLGKHMGDINKQPIITASLAQFTKQVPDIVYQHNGFLIYAGGDDVLALLTLEDALSCALALRNCYEQCFVDNNYEQYFKSEDGKKEVSISAAIIYEHIHSPLKNILHEAHELLDDIAKQKAGRDAIAVRVYKGSGLTVEWARKWGEATKDNQLKIDNLQKSWCKQEEQTPQFSSKFFYKIRQRFDLLYGKDGKQKNPLSDEQAIDLMAMEYVRSVDNKSCNIEDARNIVSPLIKQSKNAAKDMRITADAALFIRFLAQKGIEGGRS